MSTPETVMYDWNTIDWRTLERSVFKLQKRIYQAAGRNDTTAVHQLQRLLIKSKAAALLAVRRVAQVNRGKRTAGVDGVASLTNTQKLTLAHEIMANPLPPEAQPVRRVWIPKPGKDEKRPLGIPVMADRARQALAKMALEPEWEAKFEPNSYGFRPGRSCHDAVEAIFSAIQQAQKYVLDADIAKCFDRIDQQALLDKLGTFPTLRRAIKVWLKAGIMDGGKLFPVDEGTPQGGVISPLLANIALHGLETAVRSAFPHFKPPRKTPTVRWKPQVIRYADDFVIIHPDLDALKRAKEIAAEWLKGMGLEMKPSKTRITHTLREIDGPPGFDFLGFSVRQYERGMNRCPTNGMGVRLGFTPSIRPSTESQKRLLCKVRDILHRHRTAPQRAIIGLLNPILRGWGNYFSAAVSKDVFHRMDHFIFWKLYAWASRRHSDKGRGWIIRKYWLRGPHGFSRFGVEGTYRLLKLSDIPIERHVKVQGIRSPFDGDAVYWSMRAGKYPDLRRSISGLIRKQQGLCPRCGMFFCTGDHMVKVSASWAATGIQPGDLALVHAYCVGTTAVCDDNHRLLEEPDDGKLSRPVLETSADGDVRA
ncbi:MAG: group II intron reverse transcriptase/maturase [Planctomycetota bacterium]